MASVTEGFKVGLMVTATEVRAIPIERDNVVDFDAAHISAALHATNKTATDRAAVSNKPLTIVVSPRLERRVPAGGIPEVVDLEATTALPRAIGAMVSDGGPTLAASGRMRNARGTIGLPSRDDHGEEYTRRPDLIQAVSHRDMRNGRL